MDENEKYFFEITDDTAYFSCQINRGGYECGGYSYYLLTYRVRSGALVRSTFVQDVYTIGYMPRLNGL